MHVLQEGVPWLPSSNLMRYAPNARALCHNAQLDLELLKKRKTTHKKASHLSNAAAGASAAAMGAVAGPW